MYDIGAEIFGIIYQAKGKSACFELLENPDSLEVVLSESIKILGIKEIQVF